MASARQVQFVWTCDGCGHVETVDDSGSGRPSNWGQIVHGRMHDRLGNLTEKHLCGDCRNTLTLLLENRLGDTGDMAIAWDEGRRAMNGDPNPYREQREEPTDGR